MIGRAATVASALEKIVAMPDSEHVCGIESRFQKMCEEEAELLDRAERGADAMPLRATFSDELAIRDALQRHGEDEALGLFMNMMEERRQMIRHAAFQTRINRPGRPGVYYPKDKN